MATVTIRTEFPPPARSEDGLDVIVGQDATVSITVDGLRVGDQPATFVGSRQPAKVQSARVVDDGRAGLITVEVEDA